MCLFEDVNWLGFLYLFFITFHAFSIGLRSGELPGHSKVGIFSSDNHFFTSFVRCAGAPSYIKRVG